MPFYDFFCKGCKILVEDEFFKIADEKIVECAECGTQMEQVILKAPGLSDPGGTGQKWTNDGYQMREEKNGNLRTVKEKWEKGKNVIRDDVHKNDPNPNSKKLLDMKKGRIDLRSFTHKDYYWTNLKDK
jgi:putative FmdB family regulatory protein